MALAALAVRPPPERRGSPSFPSPKAWSETFDFSHGVADRVDDGTDEDVIPVVDKCHRVNRSTVDCGYHISLWPWSYADDAIMCKDKLRTHARRASGGVTYSVRTVGRLRCHAI